MSEYIEFAVRVPNNEADLFIARFGRGNVEIFGYLLGEEIVRCRDCKYWTTEAIFTGMCVGKRFDPDGFCAWGERKEH